MDDAGRAELDLLVAERIGLRDHTPAAFAPAHERKLVVFTPLEALDAVRDGLFSAGAGRIGAYERCSFYAPGTGTFFGGEGASPKVGEPGREERVDELRIEVVYPVECEAAVVEALVESHPYEEPAFDLYPLANVRVRARSGRVGRLEADVVARLRDLDLGPVFVRREPRGERVAVFTELPGPCMADVIIAPTGDPDVLVPEIERWARDHLTSRA